MADAYHEYYAGHCPLSWGYLMYTIFLKLEQFLSSGVRREMGPLKRLSQVIQTSSF
jgi:hypothetical protein